MDVAAELEALKRLKARYCRYLDNKDWVAWRTLFADDDLRTRDGGPIRVRFRPLFRPRDVLGST